MAKAKSPEDLSVEDLRRLLVEKRRRSRQGHLERFRRTGRVITLASDVDMDLMGQMPTTQPETAAAGEDQPLTWRQRGKKMLDRALLAVEVLGVVGLVLVLFLGFQILRDLNMQSAEAMILPTLTPTPLIGAVVLPSGHTPPNSPGGARPNEYEIPDHLRPLVQSQVEIPTPIPGPENPVRIQIPAIGVDAPIVVGDGWEQLKKGVGHHIGSANPGQPGNLVLSAHNDVFGQIFRYLDLLQNGDQVIVYTNQRSYTYIVTETTIVEPTQVEVMSATENETLTLISCYPYMVDNQRIVVKGVLQTSSN